MLNDRDNKIINIMSKNSGYINAEDIANSLQVSKKTIYRSVKKINEEHEKGVKIKTEKGKGLKLEYADHLGAVSSTNKDLNIVNITPIERRNRVMLEMLFNSPHYLDVNKVYENFFVSKSIIQKDLYVIKNTLKNVSIELVKDGNRLKVDGNEINVRNKITDILFKNNLIEFDDVFQNLNTEDVSFVRKQLGITEDNIEQVIPYPYNINIFSHLYILINRLEGNGKSSLADSEIHTDREKEIDNKLMTLSKIVMNNISRRLGRTIPDIETIYLYNYLATSRIHDNYYIELEYSTFEKEFVIDLVRRVTSDLKIDIDSNVFFDEIKEHIKAMLNRINNNVYVKNNLLKNIQSEYSELFDVIAKSIKRMKYPIAKKISNDEIGFLVLYFAKYLEQNQKEFRVLVMCASGMGISELIKVKLTNQFSNINVVDNISYLKKEDLKQYKNIDLIISTVNSDSKIQGIPVLLVSALLTDLDKKKIQTFIDKGRETYDL